MGDYIERGAAIVAVIKCKKVYGFTDEGRKLTDVYDALAALPAADVVEVVHSEWDLVDNEQYAVCLSCECCIPMVWSDDEVHWNYCPNCGAKMDMVTDSNQVNDGERKDGGQDDV